MCNNNNQQRVFGGERMLRPSVDINAWREINIDLEPQETLTTENPWLNLYSSKMCVIRLVIDTDFYV